MIEYFRLNGADSQHLLASDTRENPYEVSLCPVTEGMGQHRSIRRVGNLALAVKHSKRNHWLISTWLDGMVFRARLLEEFEKRGFTGYRLRPATVRFRDGYLSHDYSELAKLAVRSAEHTEPLQGLLQMVALNSRYWVAAVPISLR